MANKYGLYFYKVMKDSEFIGVGSSNDLRVYQPKLGQMVVSALSSATLIKIDDVYYHDSWMVPIWNPIVPYEEATITEIPEEEFRALESAQNVEEVLEQFEPPEEEIDQSLMDEIEYIRSMKIKEMRLACENAITNGVDKADANGNIHHYSFKIEDQLELMDIINNQSDSNQIMYHADNEPYTVHSIKWIKELYNDLQQNKTNNRLYFNRLKHYIQSLNTISEIGSVYYGFEIPN